MSVIVKTVESRKEFKDFIRFPLTLYKDCPYYVPNLYLDEAKMLDPRRNAMDRYSLSRKFLAYKEGRVVGRVAAIINHLANEKWDHREVRFGWIDFIDDPEVSRALIDAVTDFGKAHGMTTIAGPLGFTDFDNEGCVVEGFDEISSFVLKYNYPYYGKHFEALGMSKLNDWLEFRFTVPDTVPEKIARASTLVAQRNNLHLRKVSKREITRGGYGRRLFDLVNRCYAPLYDFTVMPDDVADQYIDSFLSLLDMRYLPVVEDAEGNVVAMALMMPSLARAARKCRGYLFPLGWWYILKTLYIKPDEGLELMLIAVDPAYRNRGVHAMLFDNVIRLAIENGFKWADSNAEMETNTSVQNLFNGFDRELMRRRRVFGKEI